MKSPKKLAFGILLAILGGAGIVLGPLLGFTEFAKPWSFFLGFIFGVSTGIGVALALFELTQMRT